jgi:neutral ceramidase
VGRVAGLAYAESVPLGAASVELRLRYRRPTPAQLRFAEEALGEREETKLPRNAKAYAERAQRLHEGPDEAVVQIQAMRVGELGMAAIPFEVFAETGLAIKELSPFARTFTVGLANGHYGYLPTPRHFELGGYETWLGTSEVEEGASGRITRAVLELLRGLRR